MAQPQKKTPIKKKATIADLKEKMGFRVKVEKGEIKNASNADKPMDWLIMPKAFQDALKLPGLPQGYVSTLVGWPNTGKSTLINHAIVAAQKQGLIPIIYDTENNFDFKYAIDMGMDAEPVYEDVDTEITDPETGEVSIVTENKIVEVRKAYNQQVTRYKRFVRQFPSKQLLSLTDYEVLDYERLEFENSSVDAPKVSF